MSIFDVVRFSYKTSTKSHTHTKKPDVQIMESLLTISTLYVPAIVLEYLPAPPALLLLADIGLETRTHG